MLKRVLPALLLSCALVGCASKPVGGPGLVVSQQTELPVPNPQDFQAQSRPFVVGPLDRLVIDVFGVEELSNKEVQVDAAGRINFPLVGEVEAAGKSPNEVATLIANGLRGRFVRNPQVAVNLRETNSQVVTVEGAVETPGLYPIIGRMTLMKAVASARGTSESARLGQVIVYRTVGGQRLAGVYDLDAVRRGVYADPEIYPNDVVVVGNDAVRALFRDTLAAVPALLTPVIVLLRQ